MKKHLIPWLVMFLAISLALPIYSMAQTTLTVESSSGDRIGGASVKSFALGNDGNLVVYLNGPFSFADLLPNISVDGNVGTYSGCTLSPPASVTAIQGASLSFQVVSSTANATFSPIVANPDPLYASFNTETRVFSWNTAGDPAVALGSYLAVFQATDGQNTSQLVVMIKINPAETVSTPTLNGPSTGTVNQSVTFIASGSTSSLGHALEYQFDWGDGSALTWGSASQSHVYASAIPYNLKVKARCTPDGVESDWSATSSITINNIPTYTVTVSIVNSAGGSVSQSSQTVQSGGTVTFTVTTNSGYTASVSEGTLSSGTWTISNVTSSHTATITFTQPAVGEVLTWGMNPLNGGRISFNANEKKTYIARVTSQVRGFEVIFVPQTDFTITCTLTMALKPDGTAYSLLPGVRERLLNLWAGYDGSIDLRIWSASLAGIVLDPYIYPGDFIITLTADKAGWGNMTTSLNP